ncbi:hypothetical protein [Hyphomicrobium sp. MC1]|uniref:hypothetical protein n=1 Tax=Hyphomicrobium sp. (strain MC1) TaxID=717785 RepID=UPI0002F7FB76|nr:hypothetical protein [Hyphomicrobium sp. MC1]
MTYDQAKAECERWFASLDREREKTIAVQKIASDRRQGLIDEAEARRRLRVIDGSPTVYDGAELEKAVRFLVKNFHK